MAAGDARARYYDDYLAFKAWEGARPPVLDEIFAIETARAGIGPPADVLEIGFGAGHFLDWAQAQGYRTTGVEIIAPLVAAAAQRGHRALEGRPSAVLDPASDRFDLIAAFDVLEHMTVAEIADFLALAHALLKPGGRLIARFPNGASPFGSYYQAGDITHVTALSASSLGQIALSAGMELVRAGNAARPIAGGRAKALAQRARYLARDLIEAFVGRLYFGRVVPLDPNITVVLAKAGEQGASRGR
jgi:2-polyprenyl-3-methyl-5-hydroxy-6-metoxy-1,4-benzoquinol methylase